MKLKLILLGFILLSSLAYAQNMQEAYQFSTSNLNGTARYTSMSGAFGALGGDISALKDNPAGSSVFLNNYLSGTISSRFYKNELNVANNLSTTRKNNIDLNQIGAVFVFNNYNEEATINKFTIGFTYDKTASLDNSQDWRGNTDNSYANFFLNQAQGIPVTSLEAEQGLYQQYDQLFYADLSQQNYTNPQAQTAFLGYQAYLIDPITELDDNSEYTSNITGGDYLQEYKFLSKGYNGKFSGNASLAIKNKLLLGFNLNAHIINYERNTRLYEDTGSGNAVETIFYEENNLTLGSGFSFDLGTIYKLSNSIRLGASYQSPTWYSIHDETSRYLRTTSQTSAIGNSILNPDIIDIYPNYNYKTAGKINGSLAYIFGQTGLISFEYSYTDMSNNEYRSDDYNLSSLNNAIQENFTASSTYKVGGEYRIKKWSARAGYRFIESPYKDKKTVGDLSGYSLGLGYNFGNSKIDLSYYRSSQDFEGNLYQTNFNNTSNTRITSNIAATFSINL
mgnify:CR=1 FL=1